MGLSILISRRLTLFETLGLVLRMLGYGFQEKTVNCDHRGTLIVLLKK